MVCSIESKYYTCKYLEPLSLLEVVYYGYIPALELQDTLKEVVAILKEKYVDYLLLDVRSSNAIKATDENWVRTFIMPLLASTGIKRLARIACPTVIQQHIVTGIIRTINYERQYDFEMETFREREDAMEWLFTMKSAKEQMPYRGDYRALNLI